MGKDLVPKAILVLHLNIKSRKQESSGITSLKNKDDYLHSDTVSKADILNKQFHSVYTKEDHTNMPDKGPSPYPSMMKIQIVLKYVCWDFIRVGSFEWSQSF
jgi:hypothetical protein